MDDNPLPVAVIGAGPVGLAAAAHLLSRGLEPLIFEAGERVGAGVRDWAHVRVFSPWAFNIDPAAADLLEADGWTAPPAEEYPTGGEIVERYLEPLAALPAIGGRLVLGARVTAVTRVGVDKLKDAGREQAPFELIVDHGGVEQRYVARAVIDASGTWTRPNPLGAGGVPAAGERANRERIAYRIPDVLGSDRDRYAGKRVLVIGTGHSAFNALVDLVALREQEPATEIVWAVRRDAPGDKLGGGSADQLPERGALGETVRRLVEETGAVELVTGFQTRTRRWPRRADRARRRRARAGGRRGDRHDGLPPRPVRAERAAPRSRRPRRGAARARSADRPQRALLRHGPAARRRRALPPRRGRLRGRHEELRPCADVPPAHGLRAGPLGRRRPRRRLAGRAHDRLRAPRDRRRAASRARRPRCCGAGSPHEEVAAAA